MVAFYGAGLNLRNSALRPRNLHPEVVFSTTGEGTHDEEKEDLADLFDGEVDNAQEDEAIAGSSESPSGIEVTLSDGEELEGTREERIRCDPGEPTARQREKSTDPAVTSCSEVGLKTALPGGPRGAA